MIKKIHIIGGGGSGKTYIANRLSKILDIICYDLDDVFWDNDANTYGIKALEHVRDKKIEEILKNDSWIIEGVYHKWLFESFKNADIIFILRPNIYLQHFRCITRFIKRKLGILPSKKKNTLKSLIKMIVWNHDYNKNKINEILEFLKEFNDKTVILKNNNDVLKYICK